MRFLKEKIVLQHDFSSSNKYCISSYINICIDFCKILL
nr:MAG TPA: Protein of unknown function (DUF3932) [Caudoviricetes sp.]